VAAAELAEDLHLWLTRMIAGRDWVWIEGNHDPGPVDLPGSHHAALRLDPLAFRHIATDARGEVSGHYHPKARLSLRGATLSRPCFLIDASRIVMSAYGTYTGGLCTTAPDLCALMAPDALAVLTGARAHAIPMPRVATRQRRA
jgi:metallophosphoesterase superfamily enzyme